MVVYESLCAADTEAFACRLATECRPGSVFCLSGDLGVGKTAFARGFARGLGITEDIASPTFTLVHEYQTTVAGEHVKFCHFDIYRLGSEDELWEIGWDEYDNGRNILLVEWADVLRDSMPADAVWIVIEKDLEKGTDYRKITVE